MSEAVRLADEVGHSRLTLSELAKRFAVAQPSLYKHVDGIDGLQRLLTLRVLGELGDTLRRAATGKSGSDALRAVAHAYRVYARSRPGSYEAILRAPAPDDDELVVAAENVLSVLFDVFAGYGIEGADAVDAARYLRSTLHGFVTLELVGGFGMPQSIDNSFERLVTAADRALTNWN